MANQNLQAGVQRAMIAYLKEKGVSPAAAASRTAAKLPQAVALVHDLLGQEGSKDPNVGSVFAQLKVWTLANA